jgi:GNAT superfamily N-acetyltransferase
MNSDSPAAIVRLARLEDAERLAELSAQLGYPATAGQISARLARIIPDPLQDVYVAEVSGRIAGWIHLLPHSYLEIDELAEVGGIVVDEQYRGRGLGRLLMQQAEDWASQQGFASIYLRSNAKRAAAHKFYQSLGYTNIKTSYSFVKDLP